MDNATHLPVGQASYLRIEPAHRSIEVGNIIFAPELQRSPGATEAMYLMARYAFDDLGYKDAYFNDHLIALIDHLLATPDVAAPIVLVQPNVMYLYADPQLEALSPGQKTLIRMGPANEALLKARIFAAVRDWAGRKLALQHRWRTAWPGLDHGAAKHCQCWQIAS